MSDTVRSQQFESLFSDWNIPFTLDESVDIESIRRDDAAQVRRVANRALPENVDKYALQMKSGGTFPPVVVWNGVLVDGNTRLEAAKKNGRAVFPVYRIQCSTILMAKALGAALNNMNGQPLSGTEAKASAIAMMELEFTDAQIAMYCGVSAEAARQWRKLQTVDERAVRLDIVEAVSGLPKNQRMELAKITHDEPFRRMVDAITATRPTIADVKPVIKAVVDAPSDEAAVQVIAGAKHEWTPTGPQPAKHRPNRAAQQARMAIGSLLKLDPAQVVDPARRDADLQRWQDVRALADAVIHALQADAA